MPPPASPSSEARRHPLLHASMLFSSRTLANRVAEVGAGGVQLGGVQWVLTGIHIHLPYLERESRPVLWGEGDFELVSHTMGHSSLHTCAHYFHPPNPKIRQPRQWQAIQLWLNWPPKYLSAKKGWRGSRGKKIWDNKNTMAVPAATTAAQQRLPEPRLVASVSTA